MSRRRKDSSKYGAKSKLVANIILGSRRRKRSSSLPPRPNPPKKNENTKQRFGNENDSALPQLGGAPDSPRYVVKAGDVHVQMTPPARRSSRRKSEVGDKGDRNHSKGGLLRLSLEKRGSDKRGNGGSPKKGGGSSILPDVNSPRNRDGAFTRYTKRVFRGVQPPQVRTREASNSFSEKNRRNPLRRGGSGASIVPIGVLPKKKIKKKKKMYYPFIYRSPEDKAVPKQVLLMCSFDNWRREMKMSPMAKNPRTFYKLLAICSGRIQFRFRVDGEYRVSPQLPTCENADNGETDNVVLVDDPFRRKRREKRTKNGDWKLYNPHSEREEFKSSEYTNEVRNYDSGRSKMSRPPLLPTHLDIRDPKLIATSEEIEKHHVILGRMYYQKGLRSRTAVSPFKANHMAISMLSKQIFVRGENDKKTHFTNMVFYTSRKDSKK